MSLISKEIQSDSNNTRNVTLITHVVQCSTTSLSEQKTFTKENKSLPLPPF